MEEYDTILELDNAYVLGYYDKSSGKYGEALSIDVLDDPSNPDGDLYKVDKWLRDNGDEYGTSNLHVKTEEHTDKDYMPFYFKITTQTKVVDLDGKKLSKDELARGANVGLVARAVPYEYEGRSGIMRLLETIVVYEPKHKTQTNLEHIKRMRAERMKRTQKDTNADTNTSPTTIDEEQSSVVADTATNSLAESEEIPF